MAKNLGDGVSHVFQAEGYNYDKVVFNAGRPPLDSELNLSQELQELLSRRSTSGMASGWLNYRAPYFNDSAELTDSFFTQDPSDPVPEVALVNGMAINVTNTFTDRQWLNRIDMSEFPLLKSSRVDGVYLEVWRALIDEDSSGTTSPTDVSVISKLNAVSTISETVAWAVGANGILVKTDNGGTTWLSQPSPTGRDLHAVYFISSSVGYIAGDGGTLFKTSDRGRTWSQITLNVTNNLKDITIVGDGNVWVCGDEGTILKSTDGSAFVLILNTDSSTENFRSILFFDETVGWVCGENGSYLRSNDGGVSWDRSTIFLPDSDGVELAVTTRLNSIGFINLNDGWIVGDDGLILRTTDGGRRWGDTSNNVYDSEEAKYVRVTRNLNDIALIPNFPLQINLSLFDASFFKSASYIISPTILTLRYVRRSDNAVFIEPLTLASYATNQALVDAINAILSEDSKRVFTAALGFTETSYESHASTGSLVDGGSTEVRFSLGDRMWIVGDDGVVLSTTNSGAQWALETVTTSFDLISANFDSLQIGWLVGDQATIVSYDNNRAATPEQPGSPIWLEQSTDLTSKVLEKVYFEGNVNSPQNLNLNNNSIHPDVRVETATRTQVQYRIRVIEGVDLLNYPNAGLGAPHVLSQGPQSNVNDAGGYKFNNMGQVTGDYGLWKASCRGTVDDACYAIPMFLVTKRNQSVFEPSTNVNGSTQEDLNVIRPDGLRIDQIIAEDVVDIRRKVLLRSYSDLLESSFDKLLNNKLQTKMSRSPENGSQVGATHLGLDTRSTITEINNLAGGVFSSEAFREEQFIGPQDGTGMDVSGLTGLPAIEELTFASTANAQYNHNIAEYSATYTGYSPLEGDTIPGGFTGMGTPAAVFVPDTSGVTGPAFGADYPGLKWIVKGERINYSSRGMGSIPNIPVTVRSYDVENPTQSLYYNAIDKEVDSVVLSEFGGAFEGGFRNYIERFSGSRTTSTEQENRASLVRIHYYMRVTENTNTLQVPKDVEAYSVYSVQSVVNTDGTDHRISQLRDREVRDGEFTVNNSNLIIDIEDAFRIPAGDLVEVTMEASAIADDNPTLDSTVLGIIGNDRGESLDAQTNSAVSVFKPSSKSIDSFYRSILIEVPAIATPSAVTLTAPDGAFIVGLSRLSTRDQANQYYTWYATDDDLNNPSNGILTNPSTTNRSFVSKKITNVNGIGENQVTIELEGDTEVNATLLVPVLIRENTLANSLESSSAQIYYRSTTPQTIDGIPEGMEVEIVNNSDFMYVSNLGTGGGNDGVPYSNALAHIAINDTSLFTESFYYNLDGLQLKTFTVDGGYTKLPLRVGRYSGEPITFTGTSTDNFGRRYYSTISEKLAYTAEGMAVTNPRKVFVPFLAKVKTDMTAPFLRGELVLGVFSATLNTEAENQILFDGSQAVATSFYRIPGMPVVKL